MKVIIHDLEDEQFHLLLPNVGDNIQVISDSGKIRNCIGCFACWVKTPGKCVLKDGNSSVQNYDNMGVILSKADEVIIISKCCYGGYSPFVKNVFDRSISYLLPFFITKKNETHHPQRYSQTFKLNVYFYGNLITNQERETAQKLVKANCANFYMHEHNVSFYSSIDQLSKAVNLS